MSKPLGSCFDPSASMHCLADGLRLP
jgi:hypothetical protein